MLSTAVQSTFKKMNTPIPQDVGSECRKCAKIIDHFIQPTNKLDQMIPPQIIAQAKGIAILTVAKAGFMFSARGGAGLVVARLDNGGWSAPSAIGTMGFGAGGQIGAEITDFVIILNTKDAVLAFSQGNVTLGGNLSVAAGPLGRNGEIAGTLGHLAPIYSYSKTKGLFAGVSIEGSVILERKETNAAFYRRKISAKEILSGAVAPPPAAGELYRALNRRSLVNGFDPALAPNNTYNNYNYNGGPPVMNNPSSSGIIPPPPPHQTPFMNMTAPHYQQQYQQPPEASTSTIATEPQPPNPFASESKMTRDTTNGTAIALYDFDGERDGDLPFKVGDTIEILEKRENEWWRGRCGGREGEFPANYVRMA
ncbi:hypothetical protein HDV05_005604 [Chytridiales sp. JEL 0842]|nr:hypothetical protein HDV05_005604 [Chytridiales sp. JEL 0842]